MVDRSQVIKDYHTGLKVHELAQKHTTTKGNIYMILYREGIRLGRGSICKEAAEYSEAHGVQEAADKFGMKREAIYSYRMKYLKKELKR